MTFACGSFTKNGAGVVCPSRSLQCLSALDACLPATKAELAGGDKEGGLERGEAKGAKGPLSAGQFMIRAGAMIAHSEEQHGLTR